MLAQLLEDSLKRLPFEAAAFLRSKLGRRLFKLHGDLQHAPDSAARAYAHVFQSFELDFESTLKTTGGYLKAVYRFHRVHNERVVPSLRNYASNSERILQLKNSGNYIRGVLSHAYKPTPLATHCSSQQLDQYQKSMASIKPYMTAVSRHIADSQYHEDVLIPAKSFVSSARSSCEHFSKVIIDYVPKIRGPAAGYPDQLSRMFLHLMELWVSMDKAALECYPLLEQYNPVFGPDIMDPIQVPSLGEMERLHLVQTHIEARCKKVEGRRYIDIFADPSDDCFAARYYDESNMTDFLLRTRQELEEKAAAQCSAKEEEWEIKSQEYKEIIEKRDATECKWKAVRGWDGIVNHVHQRPCEWHQLRDAANNIRIQIFEHPLPSFEPAAKATLFELFCPKTFAAYQDATWLILSTLCFQERANKVERISLIRDSQLRSYANETPCQVTLGSEKKAHTECHYANRGLPAILSDICRSCGLKPRYYDVQSGSWTSDRGKASFWHHFPVTLPSQSSLNVLNLSFANWPSSNAVQASQNICPQDISVHEFMALQGLLGGTHSRWLDLLRALGEPILNFSAEATSFILQCLTLQAGPTTTGQGAFRDVHSSLQDDSFCHKLLQQLDYRLESLQKNWREPIQMEIYVTILLRVIFLTPSSLVRQTATVSLQRARNITAAWCTELQSMVTEDPTVTQFAIWASLLCKRTMHVDEKVLLEPETLQLFVSASIMLHYNLATNFATMPYSLRYAIVRDVVFNYERRALIKEAITSRPQAFISAINMFWNMPSESPELSHIPESYWFLLTVPTEGHRNAYSVHYNYFYGTLLVDGKEMSSLPLAIRSHPLYQELFGVTSPIVFPSRMSGMSFTFSETMKNGNRVHLGLRGNNRLIVRAVRQDQVLELIPCHAFGTINAPDLPVPMIKGCFHWLNIHNGNLEIRRNDIWISRPGNWWIYGIKEGRPEAVRQFGEKRETRLLEPASKLASDIVRIFDSFEEAPQIMVFASLQDGKITCELKRLELSFFINQDSELQSSRLGATLLKNQDAGTWYGLKSKILIQSIANKRQKSILVALGGFSCEKNGCHVAINTGPSQGVYLKFDINRILGRIDCAPEPKLLYYRAMLHAFTSNVFPDPLTRRTGLEEAIYLLQTGSYLPWSPLSDDNISILKRIASLSPTRSYYPQDLRCMETVKWSDLHVSMQDDRYRPLVMNILQRSSELSKFDASQPPKEANDMLSSDLHLGSRALSRIHAHKFMDDSVYHSRDVPSDATRRSNVLKMIQLLREWQTPASGGTPLIALLQDAPVIGGYDKLFQKFLLTDLLAADIRVEWGALAQKFLTCTSQDRYGLMFLLGPIAFSDDANLMLLQILVSFAMIPQLGMLQPPSHSAYYHFRPDGPPPSAYMISFMEKAKRPFVDSFKKRSQMLIAKHMHEKLVEESCEILASSIKRQWPCPDLKRHLVDYIDPAHLDVEKALEDITPEWVRLTRNDELRCYLLRVQEILDQTEDVSTLSSCEVTATYENSKKIPACRELYPSRIRVNDNPTLSKLLGKSIIIPPGLKRSNFFCMGVNSTPGPLASVSNNVPRQLNTRHEFPSNLRRKRDDRLPNTMATISHAHAPGINKLRAITASFQDPKSFVQNRYAHELDSSIDALEHRFAIDTQAPHQAYTRITGNEIRPMEDSVMNYGDSIRTCLEANDPHGKWLALVGLWPGMTNIELLTELRSTSNTSFGFGTKEALIYFGLAITDLQHLLRVQDHQKRMKKQQERDEWANPGHINWKPMDHVDWLLLEIDSNILLRDEQVKVALATICPESGENAVLQLLMGKGKTSCILPMVAADLANKDNLARIVVPRALLLQSAQIIQDRLGGLVNREIIHIPFSRRTPTDRGLMQLYGRLHSQVRARNGVVLALPEHILSFKLSGLQQLCDNQLDHASVMIKIQDWLDKNARDVLDECDVSLAIRTQLIYPSGTQTTFDGHPLRWQVTQALLHLVKDFCFAVQSQYPRSIEIVKRGVDGFPLIYFLRKDAEDYLIKLLVGVVCKGQTPSILSCSEYSAPIVADIHGYISSPTVRPQAIGRIMAYFKDKPQVVKVINLLRGLFVHRILIATLKKRWNVQYGLHPTRAPIAVPYLAKGVPSPTAEWGHPDVCIVLTCLSFYYQGLSTSQFRQAFDHLLRSDEPSVEYEKWFPKGMDVPREFEDYAAINFEDTWQINSLHGMVRSSASLVDFFLNNFVFPKYAKTFRLKLQASGWNLFPSTSIQSECRVTGFSGTNDSRHQLPMLVKQGDLPHLAHTNAEVLYYLLAPRNQGYVRMNEPNGARWTESDLIDHLAAPFRRQQPYATSTGKIRILIDAGAQILEHSNRNFARAWLEKDTDANAAVYFDDDNRAWVIYRTGASTPLLASPFADHLDRCVIYIDESHCRGTDLKFPPDSKAALTLGQHLTKDAMVQAAMRLRLLGQSQSVVFYSPPEVHQGILDRMQKDHTYRPKSDDVLHWVIGLTCDTIEQQDPSYFAQTTQYLQQAQGRYDYPNFIQSEESRDSYLSIVRVNESLSLKQLYEPRSQRRGANLEKIKWHPALAPFAEELSLRKKHFQDRGTAVHASALEEVEIEQEREAEVEVETEVEQIREVQLARQYKDFDIPKLHKDIEHFAKTGILAAGSNAFKPMFSTLGHTALGLKYAISPSMKSNLWTSTEFNRTVEVYEARDNFIRQCQWVMWSSESQKALLVSPEEANALIPILRKCGLEAADHKVHLIVYSAPVTRRMLHFNSLDYHATPALPADFKAPVWLRVELGIFSGRLHLEWDEYHELLRYLGLGRDLSIDPELQPFAKKPLTFRKSPSLPKYLNHIANITIVHEWLALRRKGQDFEHTPMGFVTTGKPLTENHPFFRSAGAAEDADIRPQVARLATGRVEDKEEEHDSDHDEEEFVPAVELIDDSDGHESEAESDEDEGFVDALEGEEEE